VKFYLMDEDLFDTYYVNSDFSSSNSFIEEIKLIGPIIIKDIEGSNFINRQCFAQSFKKYKEDDVKQANLIADAIGGYVFNSENWMNDLYVTLDISCCGLEDDYYGED
jgi:hypothetical protein